MSNFSITEHFAHREWLDDVRTKLHQKMLFASRKADEVDFIPYTTENGQWKGLEIDWWTNGFWPAMMWQMNWLTGDETYRTAAIRAEKMMDQALENFKVLHHDVGFMWLIHSGVHYGLEKNQDSFDRTYFAANLLAGRFNPNGFIRAWNGSEQQGWSIIDTMMNLPLLYWASDVTKDPRYRLIAKKHADTAMKHFVRADGSCNHIVIFDPETGEFLENPAGQGAFSGSSWSRGQAWALYGFTLSYLCTGKAEYLETAKRVANYFITNTADDYIARCDFRQPAECSLKDNAAGACAASALLELCQVVPTCDAAPYFDAAVKMLMAMEQHCIDWSFDQPALLTQCTGAYSMPDSHHITMNYADFFFVEAIGKLRGEKRLAWIPQRI